MRTDRRVAAETKAVRTGFVPLFATGSLILALAALALPVRAETVIKSYGISKKYIAMDSIMEHEREGGSA